MSDISTPQGQNTPEYGVVKGKMPTPSVHEYIGSVPYA